MRSRSIDFRDVCSHVDDTWKDGHPTRGRRVSPNDSARLVETAARVPKARGVGADATELALAVRSLVLAPRDELPGQAAGLIDPRRRPGGLLVLGRTHPTPREPDERGGCPAAFEEPPHTRHSAPILRHHFEMLAGRRNLLLLNGREWKHYQSALKSALHQQARSDPTRLQRITIERTRALVQNIQAQIGRDGGSNGSEASIHYSSIGEFTKMITQDVFGLAALSFDFRCCANLQLSEFAHAFEWVEDDILDRCTRNAWLPQNMCYSFPTQRNKMFLKKKKYLRRFLRDIVHDRLSDDEMRPRAKKDSTGSSINTAHDNDDILEKLIEAHKAMQQPKSTDAQEDLVDILLSVLLAGYDTVQHCAHVRDISHQSTSTVGGPLFRRNRSNQQRF